MNFVEPIRDRKKIAQIKNLLRGQCRYRDLLLFVVGINTALRISDLLQLRIGYFLDEQHHMKRRFWIKEQKRGKRHEVVVNASVQAALDQYLAAYSGIVDNADHFLFFNTKTLDYSRCIRRGQASKLITHICREIGLRSTPGTLYSDLLIPCAGLWGRFAVSCSRVAQEFLVRILGVAPKCLMRRWGRVVGGALPAGVPLVLTQFVS